MRALVLIAMLVASPVAACDLEGMFEYDPYIDAAANQAAADAMREAAIARARDNFMTRFGMVQTADATAGEAASPQAANAVVLTTSDNSPRQ